MNRPDFRIARASKAAKAKEKIIAALEHTSRLVFSAQDLYQIFQANRESWSILAATSREQFIKYLQAEIGFRQVQLSGSTHSQSFTRYVWKSPSPLEVASSLRSTAYLCHSSALFLHGLTVQLPKVLYVNYEQSAKPRSESSLTQEGIDRAFRNKQRQSTFAFDYEQYKFILLSGKNTKRLEVSSAQLPEGGTVEVTSLERTLIDISVRPVYAGGVQKVQEAFKEALPRVSIGTLIATLRQLDYVYPYHQAIGFYLQRAGAEEEELKRLAELGINYRFYLMHGITDLSFDERWQLFYPKGA